MSSCQSPFSCPVDITLPCSNKLERHSAETSSRIAIGVKSKMDKSKLIRNCVISFLLILLLGLAIAFPHSPLPILVNLVAIIMFFYGFRKSK